MKFCAELVLFVSLLSASPCLFADTQKDCYSKIQDYGATSVTLGVDRVSDAIMICFDENLDFKKAADELCSHDRSLLTEKFNKYIVYHSKSIKLWQELKDAKTNAEKSIAITKMNANDEDWALFGFKNEVGELFNDLNLAMNDEKARCLR